MVIDSSHRYRKTGGYLSAGEAASCQASDLSLSWREESKITANVTLAEFDWVWR